MSVFDKLKKELKDEGRRQLEEKLTLRQPSAEQIQKLKENIQKIPDPKLEIEKRLDRIERALSMLAHKSLSIPEDIDEFNRLLQGHTSTTQDQF